MAASPLERSKSDPPPPIMVEDTATGGAPQPSPSPSQQTRFFSSFEPHSKPQVEESYTHLRERRQSTWEKGHRRKHSPGVGWHEKWGKDSWQQGRVLLIDYVSTELTGKSKQKIVAQEFKDIDSLRKFYRNDALSQQAALRVIHVQNASWATRFLIRKFNIKKNDDDTGTDFGRWARYEQPQRRGGKPVLNGKSFPPKRDPWRGIINTAFGCDYLHHSDKPDIMDPNNKMKMMELNKYDNNDQPMYGYDIFVQRMSVYVQVRDPEPGFTDDPDFRNPYKEAEWNESHGMKTRKGTFDVNGNDRYVPKLETLDNGNTIILFEYSNSGSVQDTLVGAREQIETRWRRLTFYRPRDETDSEENLVMECMDILLRDIFKALAFNWERFMSICETHVSILEEKIYENPADESRAPELWTNSSLWLKIERLIYLHTNIVKEMRVYMKDIFGEDPTENQAWLGPAVDEFEKLEKEFDDTATKPTANLSDLMYKSVGIRDARHSLQLGLSMWRLSWITFIFLPLTFVAGFFGMNVDTFEENPSIKWWFIATIPLFAVVLICWFGVKHTLASQRQNPLRRGVYESLYYELAGKYPNLWTRGGPAKDITIIGTMWANLKWRLLTRWFNADRTLLAKGYDPGDEELGSFARVKRYLARRWLANLRGARKEVVQAAEDDAVNAELGHVSELVESATPVAIADAEPTAASRLHHRKPLERWRSRSPSGSDQAGRSRTSSEGRPGSGIMVEEKGASEDERSGGEEDAKAKQKTFQERLNVPLYPGGAGIVAGGL